MSDSFKKLYEESEADLAVMTAERDEARRMYCECEARRVNELSCESQVALRTAREEAQEEWPADADWLFPLEKKP
jgi:hypothetical protein